MSRLFISSGAILAAMMQPAAALVLQYDGEYDNRPVGFLILLFVFVALIIVCGFIAIAMSPPPPPRRKTADEYNAEAVLLAAERNHTDMMTELRKSQLEAARVEAVHKDQNEIIAHDKKLRNLNSQLDEKRGEP
jgi:hypothetical protein